MKKLIILIVIPFILQLNCTSCFSQIKLTLQQAIDSALNRNLQIKQGQFNVDLSKENLKQAKYNVFPSIIASPQLSFNAGRVLDVSTYSYINQRIFSSSGSIGAQVALFQGGQLQRQIVQNKLILDADQSSLARIKNDLILAVATTFLQNLASEDLLKASQQQVNLAKLTVEKVKKSVDAGNKSLADLAQAQAQQAMTELDQTDILNQLDAGMLTLRQLMEIQSVSIELIKPNISNLANENNKVDTAGLWEEVLSVNPEVKLANLQKTIAYQGIKVAKSSLYPSLNLFGSMGTNFSNSRSLTTDTHQIGYDTIGFVSGTNQYVLEPAYRSSVKRYPFLRQFSDNFYQSVGLSLNIPLSNHFTSQINIRKAKIIYQNSEVALHQVVDNLYKIFSQALANLHAAEKRLLFNQSNYEASKQVLYISEKRYQAGLLNSVDYSIALTNYNKAEFGLISARYDVLFRRKIIDYYIGKPLNINVY